MVLFGKQVRCVWFPNVAPKVVAEDFEQSKAAMLTLLKVKTSHFDKLPWLFCALAHRDEEVARRFAVRIRSSWREDPRRVVHHRLTWKLMSNSRFSQALDDFISGTPRSSLPILFREAVAAWRFIPVVETTIEGLIICWAGMFGYALVFFGLGAT